MPKLNLWKMLLLVAFLAGFLYIGFETYSRQFSLNNITLDWPALDQPIEPQKLQQISGILGQPYKYLDRGKQSFVFESQDGRYVLKFFDARCSRSGEWYFFTTPDDDACVKRLAQLVDGYRLADKNDKDLSGLIFVQLARNRDLHLCVEVVDRFGLRHFIDLSQVPFVVQYKATPTRLLISQLLDKGDIEGAKRHLRAIVDLYLKEYRHGFYDQDRNFMYNTGFVEGRAIRIDLGRLRADEKMKDPQFFIHDLNKVVIGRLGEWLGRHFPKYKAELLADMQLKLEDFSGVRRAQQAAPNNHTYRMINIGRCFLHEQV